MPGRLLPSTPTAATGSARIPTMGSGNATDQPPSRWDIAMARELVEVELRWRNTKIYGFTSQVDPKDADDVEGLFRDAVTHDPDSGRRQLPEYELKVRRTKNGQHLFTYVGRST